MRSDWTYVASCSFGKDSLATVLLAIENNEPLDRVVYSEVMFDKHRGISGENPEHIEWIRDTAIPRLESYGLRVDVVRDDKDYMELFHKVRQSGDYRGCYYGFLLEGKCLANRELRVKPIRDYLKQFPKVIQYIGIAIDEPERLKRLTRTKISLLAKYRYTEAMAMELCSKYDLVSPIYQNSSRGGCWFCPSARLSQFRNLKKLHPNLWSELLALGKTEGLCSYIFKAGLTIEEVDRKISYTQLNLFDDEKE